MTPQPQPPEKKGLSTLVIILIIGGVALFGCCILGTLAAIAVPNFMKFQARSKQSECKTALKAAYTAQKMYSSEHDGYSEDPAAIGFSPDGKRYVYLLGPTGKPVGTGSEAQADAIRAHVTGLGLQGKCPDCEIVMGCGGNIDSDPEIDVFSISSADRTSPGGSTISKGIPFHDFDDITDAPGE